VTSLFGPLDQTYPQIVLLINFIYMFNEFLVDKDNKLAWTLIVMGTVVTFGLGLVLIGFSYHLYSPE
jgi:hypothetical protein